MYLYVSMINNTGEMKNTIDEYECTRRFSHVIISHVTFVRISVMIPGHMTQLH